MINKKNSMPSNYRSGEITSRRPNKNKPIRNMLKKSRLKNLLNSTPNKLLPLKLPRIRKRKVMKNIVKKRK